MGVDNLLTKARRNTEVADWAEKKAFYDVAVSRYYYSLYQKAIYILNSGGTLTFPINLKFS